LRRVIAAGEDREAARDCRAAGKLHRGHARADVIESIGHVTATLDGSTLTVKGTFSNFTSPATGGSFRIGLAKGVPGDAIGALSVEHARQGSFSGSIKLNASQLAALKRQSIYVRIDSEKSPDGNVQGWLEESGKDHVS
jgi:hypothetical protein